MHSKAGVRAVKMYYKSTTFLELEFQLWEIREITAGTLDAIYVSKCISHNVEPFLILTGNQGFEILICKSTR